MYFRKCLRCRKFYLSFPSFLLLSPPVVFLIEKACTSLSPWSCYQNQRVVFYTWNFFFRHLCRAFFFSPRSFRLSYFPPSNKISISTNIPQISTNTNIHKISAKKPDENPSSVRNILPEPQLPIISRYFPDFQSRFL